MSGTQLCEILPKTLVPLLRCLPDYGIGRLVENVKHSKNVRYLVANVRPWSDGKKGDVYAFRIFNLNGQKRITPQHGPELSLGRLPWDAVDSVEKLDKALEEIDQGFVTTWDMRKRLQIRIGSSKNSGIWRLVQEGEKDWTWATNWRKHQEDLSKGEANVGTEKEQDS